MVYVLSWWLAVEILGLAVLPLGRRLFRNLPDSGYALAKPLGILLTSYLFWLTVSFGLLANTRPAIMVCILLLAAGSLSLCLWNVDRRDALLSWLRQNVGLILTHELLFAVAFGVWALVRAYNPEIAGTEKPMDFAFLNAILRSEQFPPLDPWLSGFGISYYYFGYLMMAVLTKLTAVPSEVGFNLAIALLFALTASGAFSLTYNLVQRHAERKGTGQGLATIFGVVGAIFVAVIGNLEGLLEVLHTRGLGTAAFWGWIDVKNLATAPVGGTWIPTDNWWWWRASRVVHDVVLGVEQEVIDEFPFFSFLLGDMHPHVLGLPFVLLALGLALNILWSGREAPWWHALLLGVCIGGLGFLNSWDLPLYFLICVVAYALANYGRLGRFDRQWITDVGFFALVLMALSIVLYLPFWLGLRSQARGIGFVVLVKTRLQQYLLMFGTFMYVIMAFLGYGLWRTVKALRTDAELGRLRHPVFVGAAALVLLSSAALLVLVKLYLLALLVLLIGGGCVVLWERLRSFTIGSATSGATFVLILILMGLLLTSSVEFVYLRDTFDTRMNTVFKFYYQAWVLFAISSAFGIYYLGPWVRARRKVLSSVWIAGLVSLFLAGMLYPTLATHNKTGGFAGPPTLDGMAHLEGAYGDDLAAIRWLRDHVEDAPVILEATGGSYTNSGRVSVHTGLPTLLGWGGHELQWRGNYEEPDKREPDIETLYESPDLGRTSALLEEYDIRYVYIGDLERFTYDIDESVLRKFDVLMDVVYQQGQVTIYERRE